MSRSSVLFVLLALLGLLGLLLVPRPKSDFDPHTKRPVHIFTPHDLDAAAGGDTALIVEFHLDSGHQTKQLHQEFYRAAAVYMQSPEAVNPVQFACLNAITHSRETPRYDGSRFPKVLFFEKGNKHPEVYHEGRNAVELVKFLNEKTGNHVEIPQEMLEEVETVSSQRKNVENTQKTHNSQSAHQKGGGPSSVGNNSSAPSASGNMVHLTLHKFELFGTSTNIAIVSGLTIALTMKLLFFLLKPTLALPSIGQAAISAPIAIAFNTWIIRQFYPHYVQMYRMKELLPFGLGYYETIGLISFVGTYAALSYAMAHLPITASREKLGTQSGQGATTTTTSAASAPSTSVGEGTKVKGG